MALNDECKHNISDDDCYKCFKHGIIYSCPVACEHFEDIELNRKTFLSKAYDLKD